MRAQASCRGTVQGAMTRALDVLLVAVACAGVVLGCLAVVDETLYGRFLFSLVFW